MILNLLIKPFLNTINDIASKLKETSPYSSLLLRPVRKFKKIFFFVLKCKLDGLGNAK